MYSEGASAFHFPGWNYCHPNLRRVYSKLPGWRWIDRNCIWQEVSGSKYNKVSWDECQAILGSKRNEIAEMLAKGVRERLFTGPEPIWMSDWTFLRVQFVANHWDEIALILTQFDIIKSLDYAQMRKDFVFMNRDFQKPKFGPWNCNSLIVSLYIN